jgi:hypothetical protein
LNVWASRRMDFPLWLAARWSIAVIQNWAGSQRHISAVTTWGGVALSLTPAGMDLPMGTAKITGMSATAGASSGVSNTKQRSWLPAWCSEVSGGSKLIGLAAKMGSLHLIAADFGMRAEMHLWSRVRR